MNPTTSHARVRARSQVFGARSDCAFGDSWDGAPRFGEAEVIAKFKRLARDGAVRTRSGAQIDAIVDTRGDVRTLTALIG